MQCSNNTHDHLLKGNKYTSLLLCYFYTNLLSQEVDRSRRSSWPFTDKDLAQRRIVRLQCSHGWPHAFQLGQVESHNKLKALLGRVSIRHGFEQIRATESRAITLKQRAGFQDTGWEAHLHTKCIITFNKLKIKLHNFRKK